MEKIIEKCNSLKNQYSFWYHNPNDINWDIDSYHEILHFFTVEEFWVLCGYVERFYIENGMFFMMKEDIKPIWEDSSNISGGCVSIKIDKDNAYEIWEKVCVLLISDNLGDNINGISISPKKNFNIIKIWLSKDIKEGEFKIPDELGLEQQNCLYRSHKVNIEKDKVKAIRTHQHQNHPPSYYQQQKNHFGNK